MSTKKIVLFTGSNTGLGFLVAGKLAKIDDSPFHVILCGRTDEKVSSAYDKLVVDGMIPKDSISAIKLDVTLDDDIAKAVELVKNKFGRLDILVNNGAIHGSLDPIPTRQGLLESLNTNAASAALMIEAFKDLLLKAPSPRIWNITSTLGSLRSMGDPSFEAHGYDIIQYPVSKAALNMVTVMYAKRFKDTRIKVNSYSPPYVPTALTGFTGPVSVEDGADNYTKLIVDGTEQTGVFESYDGRWEW